MEMKGQCFYIPDTGVTVAHAGITQPWAKLLALSRYSAHSIKLLVAQE